jgi:hypothetical protein
LPQFREYVLSGVYAIDTVTRIQTDEGIGLAVQDRLDAFKPGGMALSLLAPFKRSAACRAI